MTEKPAATTAADKKTDARNPDTVADKDPTSPVTYGVHETDADLNSTFGFRPIADGVPDDLHDPKPGEGPRAPVRQPSVAGTGDTMRERAEYREKQAKGAQNTAVDPKTVTTK